MTDAIFGMFSHRHFDQRQAHQGKRSNTSFSGKNDHAAKTCFYCGKTGHIKRECKKRARDNAKVAVDFACPAVESAKQTSLLWIVGVRTPSQRRRRHGADGRWRCYRLEMAGRWWGVLPCLGFRSRSSAIEIQVGGGHKIFCSCVGDLIMVTSPQRHAPTMIKLRAVRVVPGFGSNLLSGPRMVKAGWSLTQCDGMFTALDQCRHVVFSIP